MTSTIRAQHSNVFFTHDEIWQTCKKPLVCEHRCSRPFLVPVFKAIKGCFCSAQSKNNYINQDTGQFSPEQWHFNDSDHFHYLKVCTDQKTLEWKTKIYDLLQENLSRFWTHCSFSQMFFCVVSAFFLKCIKGISEHICFQPEWLPSGALQQPNVGNPHYKLSQ